MVSHAGSALLALVVLAAGVVLAADAAVPVHEATDAGAAAPAAAAPCAASRLRVEYMPSPVLGVDTLRPRFSWALCHSARAQAQSAYRVRVVRTDGTQDVVVWDSGVTKSNVSSNVPYPGSATQLVSDGSYDWNVQYMDAAGTMSPWASQNATFTTGLFAPSDWRNATWIGLTTPSLSASATPPQHTLLRKTFSLAPPSKATIQRAMAYVAAGGYYKLHVDGTRVSSHELGPFTTYQKRVYYETFDCTDALFAGSRLGSGADHVLAVEIGPGYYAQSSVNVGFPVVQIRLSVLLSDGSHVDVVSNTDPSWTAAAGPVVLSDIYEGETYDARLEQVGWTGVDFDPSVAPPGGEWHAAVRGHAPSSDVVLSSHAVMPMIGIRRSYSAIDMYVSSPGTYVFDFGQNMAGITTLTIPEGLDTNPGTNISMLHAELVFGPPPAPVQHHYGGHVKEVATYLTRGNGDAVTYTPLFTYMGFRYVALTGYPGTPTLDTLQAHFLNTQYELIGDISFSDPNLDAVQHITRAAAMSNYVSIPTDCPQRERRGWLGDAQLSSRTNTFNFAMAGPYSSFVQQIADAQQFLAPSAGAGDGEESLGDNTTGAVPDCVPWYGHGHYPADPAWGTAFTVLAELVGEHYHDDDIFAAHYDGLRAHLMWLVRTAGGDGEDGLLDFSWWGDWCPPSGCAASPTHTNSALVSSFEYINQLRTMSRYAGILGHSSDEAMFGSLATNVSNAFVSRFFDAANATFREPGRNCSEELTPQTTISLATTLGLVPAEHQAAVTETLVHDILVNNNGHLNVGIVGVHELLSALTTLGRVDVALAVYQNPDEPGYVYMVKQGATTLWETWTGTEYKASASRNHIMFGANSAWTFESLAGIAMAPGARGFQRLQLAPSVWAWGSPTPSSVCANLSSVDASVATQRGTVAAAWKCDDTLSLCLSQQPEQSTAHLECPGGSTIKSIDFASFGTPNGTCADAAAMAVNPTCNAPQSMAVVEKLCDGKQACDIPVNNDAFGGDPCLDVVKTLAVKATCSTPSTPYTVWTYNVTVPVGSTASVVVPVFGDDAASATSPLVVQEGGTPVWQEGKFVGVSAAPPGVTGAEVASASLGGGSAVAIEVGSGSYAFTVAR